MQEEAATLRYLVELGVIDTQHRLTAARVVYEDAVGKKRLHDPVEIRERNIANRTLPKV